MAESEKQPVSLHQASPFLMRCCAEDHHSLPMLFCGDLVAYGPEGGKLERLSDDPPAISPHRINLRLYCPGFLNFDLP